MVRTITAAVIIVALGVASAAAQARFGRPGDEVSPVISGIRRAPPTGPSDRRAEDSSQSPAGRFKASLTFVPRRAFDGRRSVIPFGLGWASFGYVPLWDWNYLASGQTGGTFVLLPQGAPLGGVQLDVEPRSADVYVDGTYAGRVSDFSGYYNHLDLVAGPHVIMIVAPNYEPLIVHLLASSNHTTTYRGSLARAYGR